jgi:hypothetical protein
MIGKSRTVSKLSTYGFDKEKDVINIIKYENILNMKSNKY